MENLKPWPEANYHDVDSVLTKFQSEKKLLDPTAEVRYHENILWKMRFTILYQNEP